MTIRVLEPGAFTTVQDLGRPGWRSSGVPPSGAMDPLAFRLANLLAGNREDAAGLEITMIGPLLTFEHDAVVALAGASFDAELNGEPMPAERSVRVPAGATLRIAKARRGVRSYLALRGGVDVPPVLGSRSTFAQGGLGGVRGAALKPGDYLRAGTARGYAPMRRATPGAVFDPAGDVRAMRGPQAGVFHADAAARFWSQTFRASPRSDRAGVRLDGEPIAHHAPDIDPEGVVAGAVQIPGDGLPIVLGPDGPATGGYAKIATVITADLPSIAQARPGDTLRFVEVGLSEARAAWRERERALAESVEDLT